MNLKQLRYICEVWRQGNHISAAAEALHTSQPGISKQIQMMESELGFEIFLRRRNRIVDLTEPGREAVAIAQRVLTEVGNLKNLADDFNAIGGGRLTIATTHTMARYVLPKIVEKFMKKYNGDIKFKKDHQRDCLIRHYKRHPLTGDEALKRIRRIVKKMNRTERYSLYLPVLAVL